MDKHNASDSWLPHAYDYRKLCSAEQKVPVQERVLIGGVLVLGD